MTLLVQMKLNSLGQMMATKLTRFFLAWKSLERVATSPGAVTLLQGISRAAAIRLTEVAEAVMAAKLWPMLSSRSELRQV
jgi:hypothetical protein